MKPVVLIGLAGLILYVSTCLVAYLMQRRFVFVPQAEVIETPSQFQAPYQDLWIPLQTDSGAIEQIHGWWIPTPSPALGTLLYLHGNGINIGANARHAVRFRDMGFDVLMIDYRGYGKSKGDFPSEQSVYADAEAAWQYLVRDRKLDPQDVYLYGHSLGGAIAIDLATRHPDMAGLIIDGSFTSIQDVAQVGLLSRLLPLQYLLHQRFDSKEKIKGITTPAVFIHGTDDEIVPVEMSQELYEAKPGFKKLVLVPGANHNNVAATDLLTYTQAVQDLVQHVRKVRSPLSSSR